MTLMAPLPIAATRDKGPRCQNNDTPATLAIAAQLYALT